MRNKQTEEIKHLIYASKPSIAVDDDLIAKILSSSRKNNVKHGITGALIYGDELYLQFLEGPKQEIEDTFSKIKADSRHQEIKVLKDGLTSRRLFASWTMREDSVATWMWSKKELDNGLIDRLTEEQAFNVFNNLSREIDQFSQI